MNTRCVGSWRRVPRRRQSSRRPEIPGIAQVATCLATTDYLAAAESIDADLTVVGPEAPLVAGIVDQFRAQGPADRRTDAGGGATGSEQGVRQGVHAASRHSDGAVRRREHAEDARAALGEFGFPVVLKADGLAAAKASIIANDAAGSRAAIAQLMTGRAW